MVFICTFNTDFCEVFVRSLGHRTRLRGSEEGRKLRKSVDEKNLTLFWKKKQIGIFGSVTMGREGKIKITPAVIEEIFNLHYDEMYLVARRYLDVEESQDIVQEVFLKLVERGETEVVTSLKAYLYRAVIHTCLNWLKQKRVRNEYAYEFRIRLLEEEAKKVDGGSDALVTEKELLLLVRKTVTSLPEKSRKIFEMSRYDGLTHKEIAKKMNISVRTVETQVYRALKVLHRELGEYRRS